MLNLCQETLSTDRPFPSSAFLWQIPLAISALFALIFLPQAIAQRPSRHKHKVSTRASALSVGQRLAADLQWPQAERDHRFAHMDLYFPVHIVHRRGPVRTLPPGEPLEAAFITAYMKAEHLAGVLVLQNGRIRSEQYAFGLSPNERWTSFSVTKAITDTLAGAALHDGELHSLDDDVTSYLPEMRGSAYDSVTVRQLMTMTSGVRWNENYTARDADNVLLYSTRWPSGSDPAIEYMRRVRRDAPPGTHWRYNTGETDLLGVLLRRVTGRTLADQLSQAIWRQAGMEHDATWIATSNDRKGQEFGGSGLSATLRDFGRLGQWVLKGSHRSVSPEWLTQATHMQVQADGSGYGYGWWPQPDGSFAALGIFGQSILIDPKHQLVIVTLGDWLEATGAAHTNARNAFWAKAKEAADAK